MFTCRIRSAYAVALFLVFTINVVALSAPTYTITNLGTLPAPFNGASHAYAINDSGVIVGDSHSLGGGMRAVRSAPHSAFTAASNLGSGGGISSQALGINERGDVVGGVSHEGSAGFAFRIAPTATMINPATDDLGTLGGNGATASGINDLGQAVGTAKGIDGVFRPFRTAPYSSINPQTDLLTAQSGFAQAIDNAGRVVGAFQPTIAVTHAFRTAPNGNVTGTSDLGTLSGTNSVAFAINNSGRTVGRSSAPGPSTRPFRIDPDAQTLNPAVHDLGTLGGDNASAFGINDAGEIVGQSNLIPHITDARAFVYLDEAMYDLNSLISPPATGWTLRVAGDINNHGEIVGYGSFDPDGPGGAAPVERAFLLRPIPEPSTLPLAATLLAVARRSKKLPQIGDRLRPPSTMRA